MKRFLLLPSLPLCAALLLPACGGTQEAQEAVDDAVLVRVDTLRFSDVDREIEYTASLEANEQVYFAPTLTGTRIKKIYVEVGDRIRKGQVLVEMDANNLDQQRLQLKNLETEYNRAVKLMETGSISQQNFDQVATQYEVAKTAIANLSENTKLVAPFNGVVTGKYMEEGELYGGGAYGGAAKPSIISIEEINPMKAIVNISERYYLEVKKGMGVELRTDVYGDERAFPGRVNIVYPSIDPKTRTFSVELLFDNAKEDLRPGMYGKVRFSTGRSRTILVQSIAVLKVQGSNDRYVFLDRDGVAKRVSVKIVNRYDDKVAIEALDGEIREGDLVVSTGQAKLVDGRKLKVKE